MNDLPDINVWLALIDRRHTHHRVASRYWDDPTVASRAFCRVTTNGFLRLCTHPKVVPSPLSPHEAWITYQQFLATPGIRVLREPAGLDRQYCTLTCAPGFAHGLWTDAYLASLAMVSGCRLVSLDADFKRFPGLQFLHLNATN